jgi:hypothetical protein
MNIQEIDIRIWLALGLVPYHIGRQRRADGSRLVQIQALFWSYEMRRQARGSRSWTLHITLIERLREAAWAVADQLRSRPDK